MADIFGDIINSRVSVTKIPTIDVNMKILVISDTHIGTEGNPSEAIPKFMASLREVIAKENPTHIFHLGDLISGYFEAKKGGEWVRTALTEMATLGLPVYAIGGNHDREYYKALEWPDKPSHMHPISLSNALLVETHTGKKLYFAHDLENNLRIRDQLVYPFLCWIKKACRATIKPNDWLLTGHVHTAMLSMSAKVGAVGQFAPSLRAYQYTIIEPGTGAIMTKTHTN